MNLNTLSQRIRPALGVVLFACGLMVTAQVAAQQVPEVLPYQGFLQRSNGTPVEGPVTLTFNLYEGSEDDNSIWTETLSDVIAQDGVFYVYLGQQTDILDFFSDGNTRYLGIAVNDDAEALPRQSIGSVPYALLAGNALLLDGFGPDEFLTAEDIVNFITQQDLENYIDAQDFVTGDQIVNFITEGDLAEYLEDNDFATLTEVTNIVNDVVNNNVDLDGYVTNETFNAHVADFDALETLVNQLQQQINNLQNSVNQNTGNITNLTTNVTNLTNTVNQHTTNIANNTTNIASNTTAIANLQTQIDNLVVNGNGGNNVSIVGVTAANVQGGFSFGGKTGMAGISARCNNDFAGSHMCTLDEIQRSLSTDQFTGITNGQEYWIVPDIFDGLNASNTINNNCHGMLYPTGHIGRGTFVTFLLNYTPNLGSTGNAYNLQFGKSCGTGRRAVCCR